MDTDRDFHAEALDLSRSYLAALRVVRSAQQQEADVHDAYVRLVIDAAKVGVEIPTAADMANRADRLFR